MKKAAIILISILSLSIVLMAISPVLAKPSTVIITVKDAAGKPVPGVYVNFGYFTPSESQLTDEHGKATFTMVVDTAHPWEAYDRTTKVPIYEIYVGRTLTGSFIDVLDGVSLSSSFGGRETVTFIG